MTDPSTTSQDAGLRTVVLVKQVPRGDSFGVLDADGRLRREGLGTDMNPWCRRAVAQAVQLSGGGGGRATAVTMGPPSASSVLREAMACGVHDAVHVSDPRLAGADCLATSKVLARTVTALGPVDLVTVGRSSVDGNTAAVGTMVAELLGMPFVGPVLRLSVERTPRGLTAHALVQAEAGGQSVTVALPAVVALAERSFEPVKVPAERWADASRIVTVDASGPRGGGLPAPVSPTRVIGVRDASRAREPLVLDGPLAEQVARAAAYCEAACAAIPEERTASEGVPPYAAFASGDGSRDILVLADGSDQAGDRALLGEAAVLAARLGGRVVAVAHADADITCFSGWGADQMLMLHGGAPRAVAATLAAHVASAGLPLAVLASTRAAQREVLARLAARLDAGLLSDLTGLAVDGSRQPPLIVGTKPSGASSVAEIVSDSPVGIATVRTGSLPLRDPRCGSDLRARFLTVDPDPDVSHGVPEGSVDVDALERAEVVIGVGRGVDPAHYGELQPLRRLLGAELAATRRVTDAGWLPHALQVGITARDIAPRLYIAVGLSGNGNHMSGVSRAGTVVAVNSDPGAPVFGTCDVGIVADWREVVPLLTTELERRRSPAPAG